MKKGQILIIIKFVFGIGLRYNVFMSNLLKLEKKNQEYNFNYNCLSPLNKKDFLIWIGTYHGYNMNDENGYTKVHSLYYDRITSYYNKIKNQDENKETLTVELFDIPFKEIPKIFTNLYYKNSCLIETINFYMKDPFVNKEFDLYWNWLSAEIKQLTGFTINPFDTKILKHSFLSCNKNKLSVFSSDLESYFSLLENQSEINCLNYDIDPNQLNNIILYNFLSRAILDAKIGNFDKNISERTINTVEQLFHILDPNFSKNIKYVA